jgi:hypothetical protein
VWFGPTVGDDAAQRPKFFVLKTGLPVLPFSAKNFPFCWAMKTVP